MKSDIRVARVHLETNENLMGNIIIKIWLITECELLVVVIGSLFLLEGHSFSVKDL